MLCEIEKMWVFRCSPSSVLSLPRTNRMPIISSKWCVYVCVREKKRQRDTERVTERDGGEGENVCTEDKT